MTGDRLAYRTLYVPGEDSDVLWYRPVGAFTVDGIYYTESGCGHVGPMVSLKPDDMKFAHAARMRYNLPPMDDDELDEWEYFFGIDDDELINDDD